MASLLSAYIMAIPVMIPMNISTGADTKAWTADAAVAFAEVAALLTKATEASNRR